MKIVYCVKQRGNVYSHMCTNNTHTIDHMVLLIAQQKGGIIDK